MRGKRCEHGDAAPRYKTGQCIICARARARARQARLRASGELAAYNREWRARDGPAQRARKERQRGKWQAWKDEFKARDPEGFREWKRKADRDYAARQGEDLRRRKREQYHLRKRGQIHCTCGKPLGISNPFWDSRHGRRASLFCSDACRQTLIAATARNFIDGGVRVRYQQLEENQTCQDYSV